MDDEQETAVRLEDLPVAVDLPEALAAEVCAWVEADAGWQLVALDGPPTPALLLVDRPVPQRPCVVVVDGPCEPGVVREALLAGALDIVAWPDERDRLRQAPLRARHTIAEDAGPRVLRVAGLAGGVGTSTVALALGGVLAWSGHRCLVVGDADLLRLAGVVWSGPSARELARLDAATAAAEVAALARPLPAVPGMDLLGGGAVLEAASGWPWAAVVVDERTVLSRRPDLLVARPDTSVAAGSAWPDVPVVVVGRGPLDSGGVRRLLARAPTGWLPASARVARAGCAGRVPAGLPGTWVAKLREVLAAVAR